MFATGIEFLVEYQPSPFILKNSSQWSFFEVLEQNTEWMLLKLKPEVVNASL
jgi:hypothetical protein